MKKIILLSFFSILFLNSNAQTSVYHPFPDSSAIWCIYWGGSCGGPPDETFESTAITGDTIISGTVYKRLTTRFRYIHINTCGGNATADGISYIRQDKLQKKVWMYDVFTKKESILYDFDLKIGDTLNADRIIWGTTGFDPNAYVITSIDSALIDGSYRKRFNYHEGSSPTCSDSSMIEGIGTLAGLWHVPSDCFEHVSQIIVFQQDNKTIINTGGSFVSMCENFYTTTQELTQNKELIVSPNPSTNKFTISFSPAFSGTMSNTSLKIFNLMGEEVYFKTIDNRKETINTNLSSGIYFVRVSTEEKQFVQKMVVE